MDFRVPDEYEKNNTYIKDGVKYAKFGNICWYTTLDHYKMHEYLELNDTYKNNESKYPKYDNYDAIEVGHLDDIPSDHFDPMGVPITILQRFNPEQFELIGISAELAGPIMNNEKLKKKPGRFYIGNKRLYERVVVKRRTVEHDYS